MTYTVRAGDTLGDIAITFGVSLQALIDANSIRNPDLIWVGQELVIPKTEASVVPGPAEPIQPSLVLPDDRFANQPGVLKNTLPVRDLQPLPKEVLLEGILHDWQKMNNCGPTTVAMALSYFDLILTQFDTAPALKGGPRDKNVSPPELVDYVHSQGFGAIMRVNGNLETLQRLVSQGIPVIVEQWLDRPGDELTGHYRLVRGYSETTQEIIVNDSYSGPRLRFSYAEFDRLWRPFNRLYMVLYKPEQELLVRILLGDDWDDLRMYERAVLTTRTEIETLGDAYGWFNAGNSLLGLGEYERAAEAFDQAMAIGLPPRMLWYQFGPFEAYNQAGQYQRVIDLSVPLMSLALEELHYQRGVAFEGLGQLQAALAEYQLAVELNPRSMTRASDAIARLRAGRG
jgi:hypothetical protein